MPQIAAGGLRTLEDALQALQDGDFATATDIIRNLSDLGTGQIAPPGSGLGTDPFLVGGGQVQTGQFLDAFNAAEAAGQGRSQLGLSLLDQLIGVQRDPFSIVPALQAFGGAGGGTLAPNVAFAQTGGVGAPSPYGAIADRLIQGLSQFVGAGSPTEVSPTPVTPVSDVSSTVQAPASPLGSPTAGDNPAVPFEIGPATGTPLPFLNTSPGSPTAVDALRLMQQGDQEGALSLMQQIAGLEQAQRPTEVSPVPTPAPLGDLRGFISDQDQLRRIAEETRRLRAADGAPTRGTGILQTSPKRQAKRVLRRFGQ